MGPNPPLEAPDLAITDTDPGLKGDTSGSGGKPATLETGAVVRVPLFVQIGEIINYSKEHTRAVVEVGVAYESDLDHVFRVLDQVGKEIKEKDPDVLEPTVVRGLQNFGESELLIRTITKVKPGQHRQVQRDLRKMVKEAFDREGIEIPYARRVLILKDEEGVDRIASILERPAQ